MAAWRSRPWWRWRRKNSSDHWSCMSPPGVPNASHGSPSRSASEGESVVRGRLPGASELGRPGSSQNIWARVDSEKPSPGTTGELCSQPPLGVAETRLPHRSATSRWQVSPRVSPAVDDGGFAGARRRGRGAAAADAGQPRLPAVGRAGVETVGDRPVAEERPALVGVRRGEQRVERDVDVRRVAVPGLAVGEGELRGLGQQVDEVGRGGVEGGEVGAVEQGELLQERRSLAPRPGLEDGGAVVVERRPAPRRWPASRPGPRSGAGRGAVAR